MNARWPWWRKARIAQLERDIAQRDRALRTVRHHAREIELKAASFGIKRIIEPRFSEIELHALNARLAAAAALAGVEQAAPSEPPTEATTDGSDAKMSAQVGGGSLGAAEARAEKAEALLRQACAALEAIAKSQSMRHHRLREYAAERAAFYREAMKHG